jgi:integrase
MKAVKVTLREKKISKGRKSLYLDFYPAIRNPNTGKETRREFLGLYIYEKTRTPFETQHNKKAKAFAESIKNDRFLEIQNGKYGFQNDTKRKTSFLDFFKKMADKRYTSEGNYGNWLASYRYLCDYFEHGLTMGEISEERLEDFRDYILSLNLAQNTKHTYYNKVQAAIKEAHKKGFLPENYCHKVDNIKAEETKREFVTLDELKILAKTECDKPIMKTAFLFSALTGLRFSDIEKLKWEDIQGNDEKGYFIRYRQKKTKGQETLDIPKSAYELLDEPKAPELKVFKDLKYSAWNNLKLKEWVMMAGIRKKITFHCARHSFATIQLDLGTDIYTVQKLLGHKELKTTQIYAKVMDKNKKKAMNKLDDLKL